MGVLKTLIIKEMRQFRRNPFMPKLVVAFPLMLILVLPWIATMDVRDINVGVVDHDRSDVSQKMVSRIDASEYLLLEDVYADYASALNVLEDGKIDVILEIPDGFGESMLGKPEKLALWSNGVNAMKGSLGSQYVMQTVMQCLKEMRQERGLEMPDGVIETTNLYNPTMDYKFYMIPALLVMLLVIACALGSWLVQEWVLGIVLHYRRKAVIAAGICGAWLLLSAIGGIFSQGLALLAVQLVGGCLCFFGCRRTPTGRQTAAQILGLRRYLRRVSPRELQRITANDPYYFYSLAPYALALGVEKSFARRFGSKRLPACPWLTSGLDGHMTALEWSDYMRRTVDALDARQKRLLWERLRGK